jgi:hypothetical protein
MRVVQSITCSIGFVRAIQPVASSIGRLGEVEGSRGERPGWHSYLVQRSWGQLGCIIIEKNGKDNEKVRTSAQRGPGYHDFGGDSRRAGTRVKKKDDLVGRVPTQVFAYVAGICTHLQVGPPSLEVGSIGMIIQHLANDRVCQFPLSQLRSLQHPYWRQKGVTYGVDPVHLPVPFVRLYYPLMVHTPASIPLWCGPWRGLWESYRRLQVLVIKDKTCPSSEYSSRSMG